MPIGSFELFVKFLIFKMYLKKIYKMDNKKNSIIITFINQIYGLQ